MRALLFLFLLTLSILSACSSENGTPAPKPNNPIDTSKNNPNNPSKPIDIPTTPSFSGKVNGVSQTWVRSVFEDSTGIRRCRIYTIDFRTIITLRVQNNLPNGKYRTNSLEGRVTVEYFRLNQSNEGVTFLTNGGEIEITQNDANNFKGRLNFTSIHLFGPGGVDNPEEMTFTDGVFFFKR